MWHDNETTVDYLNFGVVADACASLLRQSHGEPGGTHQPPAAGVVPPAEHRYVVITFNPWLYQDFESARSAILQIVGDHVLELAQGNASLQKKALDLLKRINFLRLVQIGGEAAITLTTGVPVGVVGRAIGKASNLWDAFTAEGDAPQAADTGGKEKDDEKGEEGTLAFKASGLLNPAKPLSLPNEIHAFRLALEKLLEELGITLVVFVDDLDRCLPETAISTLESIRLLLFLKRTAFVIAADNDFIHGAVKKHFEGTGIKSDIATNYFDKLIQVPLHVPRIGVNEAKAYLVLLLLEKEARNSGFPQDKFDRAKVEIPQRLA
ncbi:NTPase KAP, partial [Arthrobacter stackebrandtii]